MIKELYENIISRRGLRTQSQYEQDCVEFTRAIYTNFLKDYYEIAHKYNRQSLHIQAIICLVKNHCTEKQLEKITKSLNQEIVDEYFNPLSQ